MVNLKHVGRITSTGRKCLVAYRTLPGDAYNCLVVPTENLSDSYHDALIQLVESNSAQESNEFAEVLARSSFPDGSVMLASLHTQGKLLKIPTDQVEMIPNFQTRIRLDELNTQIAENLGVAVDDLSIKPPSKKKDENVEIKEVATVRDLSQTETKDDLGKTTSMSVNGEITEPPTTSPEETAKFYRSKADKLSKEAAQFRRMAEELVPTKRK